MSTTELWTRVLAEIDDLSAEDIAKGLRLAALAFRIKAQRVTGRDRAWMGNQATRAAYALLDVSTGGIGL